MTVVTLRQRAYQQIRGQMISGELGPGSLISEPTLAKQLSIGRTPVREAIQQLEGEGLVDRVPRRGTIVQTLDRREIIELYQLREGLEGYAITLATEQITPTDLAKLDMLCEQTRLIADQLRHSGRRLLNAEMMQRFLATDMAFHMLLIHAAGNRRIVKVVGESHVMARIFGASRQEHNVQVVTNTCRFHCDILQAVKNSDGKLAQKLMVEHVRSSLRETLEHYDQMHTKRDVDRHTVPGMPKDLLEELDRIEKELSADDPEQTVAGQRRD